MTPPAGPGQRHVLKSHYDLVGDGPVAYIDETYHIEHDGRSRFYVMAAVVVVGSDRDPLRNAIDELVPGGWWHTTDQLRTESGRADARSLLQTFRPSDETCLVVHATTVEDTDVDGMQARGRVLARLLTSLHTSEHQTHPPVNLAVVEEQREARKNNCDRSVRARLLNAGAVTPSLSLVAVSPGSEHLLWLPDLVCSAYRQKVVFHNDQLFAEISDLTHVTYVD